MMIGLLQNKDDFKKENYSSWIKNTQYWLSNAKIPKCVKEKIQEYILLWYNDYKMHNKRQPIIVDVGFGDGWLLRLIKDLGVDFKYCGIDQNKAFVEYLSKKYYDDEQVDFYCCDVEKCVPDQLISCADLIVDCLSLLEMPSIKDAYRNIVQMLRLDGEKIVVGLDPVNEIYRYSKTYEEFVFNLDLYRNSAESLVINKYICMGDKMSPAEYYRILYSINDYVDLAKSNGMSCVGVYEINKRPVIDKSVAIYQILSFKKNKYI